MENKKTQILYNTGETLTRFNLKVFLGLVIVWPPTLALEYFADNTLARVITLVVALFSILSVFPAVVIAFIGICLLLCAKICGYDNADDIKDGLTLGIVEILYNLGWILFFIFELFPALMAL